MKESIQSLQQLITDIHAHIEFNKIYLDKKSLNCIASAEYCFEEETAMVLIQKLEAIKERLLQKQSPTENFSYPGDIQFSELKNLISITDEGQQFPTYLSFNPEMIKNFNDANDDELKAITNFLAHPHFCEPAGKSGIKYFKDEKPTCVVNINGINFKGEITHELKLILNNASRILFYTLKPIKNGPVILIASHFVRGGLHASQSKKKLTFTANDLITTVKNKEIAKTIAKQGLFARASQRSTEEKPSIMPGIKMAA